MTAVLLLPIFPATLAVELDALIRLCAVCAIFAVVLVIAAYWNRIVEKIATFRHGRIVRAAAIAAVLSTSFVYINDFGWCDGWWAYICMF